MSHNPVKSILRVSTLMCTYMFLTMFPSILILSLTEIYEVGPWTQNNLLILSVFVPCVMVYVLKPILAHVHTCKFTMKSWQWEFAFELISWLKRHETISGTLMMMGLLIWFVPLNSAWIWILSTFPQVSSSMFLTIYLFFLLVLPSFIIPSLTLSMMYESVVHPSNPSLSQVVRIVEGIFATRPLKGRTLEKYKKRWVRIPQKGRKSIPVCALIALASALILGQLVESGLLPLEVMTFVRFLVAACGVSVCILMVSLFFFGQKISYLDLLIGPDDNEKNEKQGTKLTGLVERAPTVMERIADKIMNSWWYKIILVLGGILSLLTAILRILGFV